MFFIDRIDCRNTKKKKKKKEKRNQRILNEPIIFVHAGFHDSVTSSKCIKMFALFFIFTQISFALQISQPHEMSLLAV